ncbi:MAG: hypothetical protein U0572_04165 [Phycisphaerales bacterium]
MLQALDAWCADTNLLRNLAAWIVAVILLTPLSAWAAILVLHAFRGGFRLVAPRCPRCKQLQHRDSQDLCTECGESLADGKLWTRRRRSVPTAIGSFGLALTILAVGLVAGNMGYAWATEPSRRNAQSTVELETALLSTDDATLERAVFALSNIASSDTRAPEGAAALRRAMVDGPASPLALRHTDPSRPARFVRLPRAIADLAARHTISESEAETLLATLDELPEPFLPAIVPVSRPVWLRARSVGGVSLRVDSVLCDGVEALLQSQRFGGALPSILTPARLGPCTIVVSWRPVLYALQEGVERVELAPRESVLHVVVSDAPPRLAPPTDNLDLHHESPTRIASASLRPLGRCQQLVVRPTYVDQRWLVTNAPIANAGRWTVRPANDDSAPNVRLFFNRSQELVALLPVGSDPDGLLELTFSPQIEPARLGDDEDVLPVWPTKYSQRVTALRGR